MYLILDTSVIIPDYRFTGPQLATLLEEAFRLEIQLATPQVVIEELVRNYGDKVAKLLDRVQELDGLIPEVFLDPEAYDAIGGSAGAYRQWLGKLHEVPNQILPLPRLNTKKALARIQQRQKPFADSEKGFKDFLIWRTVLTFLNRGLDEDVVFVTSNTNDFCDEGDELHEDLQNDLVVENVPSTRFRFYSSLPRFYEKEITPRLVMLDDVKEKLAKNEWNEFNLELWILKEADKLFEGISLNPEYFAAGQGFSTATIASVKPPELRAVESVAQFGSDQLFIIAHVAMDAVVTVSASEQEGPAASNKQRTQSYKWRTEIPIFVVYDPIDHKVASHSLGEVMNYGQPQFLE